MYGKGSFTTMFRIQRPKKPVVHFRRVWPNRSWHIPALMGISSLLLAFCLVLGVMELGTGDSSAPVQEDALLESAQEEESEAEESALQAASREKEALSLASSAVESALEESSQGAVGLAFSCYEEPQPITEEEAAALGCCISSITIQQLGVTGTASVPQVLDRLKLYQEGKSV